MKNYKWLIALFAVFAVLALLFAGCPTEVEGDDDDDDVDNDGLTLAEIFPDTVSSQEKANVTLNDNSAIFSITGVELWGELINSEYFNASAYTGISLEYKTTEQATLYLMCPDSGDGSVFVVTDWGACTESDWTPISSTFAQLMSGWGSLNTFDKSKLYKLMVGSGGNSSPSANRTFEIRNFEFY